MYEQISQPVIRELAADWDQPTAPILRRRIWPAVERRMRLAIARLRWPRVTFGSGCDVRRGLWAVVAPRATVRFANRCIIDRDMTLEVHGQLQVGPRTIFGHHCTIASHESIE